MTQNVGVFDSGIGGLTLLKTCVSLVRGVNFYYYGDNDRAPYGSRSEEVIASFVDEAIALMQERELDALLLACNTVTALRIEALRARLSFPVIGTEPAIKCAARQGARVLVLATPRTAQSERVARLVAAFPDCRFTVYGAPALARSIERWVCYGETYDFASQLPKGGFDGVVLGCTHYIYLKKYIAQFYNAPVYDGNSGTAKRLVSVLEERKMQNIGTDNHHAPPAITTKERGNRIIFLGKSAEMNKKVWFSEHLFQ